MQWLVGVAPLSRAGSALLGEASRTIVVTADEHLTGASPALAQLASWARGALEPRERCGCRPRSGPLRNGDSVASPPALPIRRGLPPAGTALARRSSGRRSCRVQTSCKRTPPERPSRGGAKPDSPAQSVRTRVQPGAPVSTNRHATTPRAGDLIIHWS